MKAIIIKILAIIVRAIYLIVGVVFCYMETAANWFIGYYRKTEYIRKGRCKKCGKCCNVLAIQYPNFFNKLPRVLKLTIRWHQFRYGFTYLNRENNYLLYKCNFLRPDGTCQIYRFRPRLCREYPKLGLYGKPPSHIECGYYFVRRDGRPTFDEALHKAYHEDSPDDSPPLRGGARGG